ncbi:MAG: hypothetical protein A2W93_09725 [Bacteroidetes bacterium GWF2_43_63]|nr:MAG: hypothetical protein A2W94_07210 [Bacteroidetes bacterium GWE2_42_42]OFY54585.1 MAG: hypothetical protein A2W93_09725 [Bacteroidetes bacterium GWF2_43_63]HBG70604.1 hypothetical protein [Bacteroidales bacterium]HCB60901.1 hypothetical protein [Bacteroidales bacterium]
MCKNCKFHFTVTVRKQRFEQSTKRHAIILFLTGLSITKIENLIGVKQTTLFKWVKEFGPKFGLMRAEQSPTVITMRTKAEHMIRILDEEWMLIYRDGKIEIRKKDK